MMKQICMNSNAGGIWTAVLVVVLVAVVVIGIKSYFKRLSSGCCGSGSARIKKKRAADRNPAHYPYHKKVMVDGMVCANCATRVENALNSLEGVWANVNLSGGFADIRMKQKIQPEELRRAVKESGYIAYSISDE